MKRTSENHTGSEDLDQSFGVEMRCVMELLAACSYYMVIWSMSMSVSTAFMAWYLATSKYSSGDTALKAKTLCCGTA
jgi:hypothetical protein